HLHTAGVARIDVHADDPPDTYPEVAHGRASLQPADAALEVDFVAVVVAMLAGIGVPEDEQGSDQRDEQHERADRGVIRFTLHERHSGARGRAPRASTPESTGAGGPRCARAFRFPYAGPRSPRHDCRYGRSCPDRG